jgi:hypothetical protein
MGKREIRERVEGAFIPLHIEKSRYISKTQNIQKTLETPGSPETPGKTRNFRLLRSAPIRLTP